MVLSTFGNIDTGISLKQFEKIAKNDNFVLIGAGAFVGQHTFANSFNSVSLGRPTKDDLSDAYRFGKIISMKCNDKNLQPIVIPKSRIPMAVQRFPERGTRFLVSTPTIIIGKCHECGLCVESCPVGAIDPKTLKVDEKKCIRCFACISVCHCGARITGFKNVLFDTIFKELGKKEKKNKLYY